MTLSMTLGIRIGVNKGAAYDLFASVERPGNSGLLQVVA